MSTLLRWVPAFVWMGFIFIFSSFESVSVSDQYVWNFLFFKMLHVIEYGILFVFFLRGSRRYSVAFLLTVLYAITDEVHQTLVPSREGTIRDVIIDATGAGLTWVTLKTFVRKMQKKQPVWVRILLGKGTVG